MYSKKNRVGRETSSTHILDMDKKKSSAKVPFPVI